MIATTNLRLIRDIRRSFERYGFVATYYATTWTNLLLKREDDQLAITCLDSRMRLDFGFRGLLARLGGISREVQQVIGTRTAFVTAFSTSDAEKLSIAGANISLICLSDLASVITILDKHSTLTTATSAQLILARQMSGMCRRFAIACNDAGDLENAIVWRLRQSELRPMSPEAYWVLAGLQTKLGRLDEAEKSADRLLELAPTNSSILLLLIDIKRKQGNPRVALELARWVQAQFPDNASVYKHVHELEAMIVTGEKAVRNTQ